MIATMGTSSSWFGRLNQPLPPPPPPTHTNCLILRISLVSSQTVRWSFVKLTLGVWRSRRSTYSFAVIVSQHQLVISWLAQESLAPKLFCSMVSLSMHYVMMWAIDRQRVWHYCQARRFLRHVQITCTKFTEPTDLPTLLHVASSKSILLLLVATVS